MTAPRDHVSALDGIRGIAVAAVVVHHLKVPGLDGLYIGVDVFFALSGFLITSSLLRDRDVTRLRSFWSRRAWRVGPGLAVLLAWYVAVSFGDPQRGLRLHFAQAAALQYINIDMADGPPPASTSPHLGHLWSLAAEVQFYALWPLVVVGLQLLFRRHVAPAVAVVAAALTAGSAIARVVMADGGASWGRLYFGPDVRATAIFAGCTVAALLAWRARRTPSPAPSGALGRAAALLVIPAIASLVWYGLAGTLTWRPGMTWGLTLVAGAAAVLVLHGSDPRPSPINRLMRLRPVVFVGTISYSLYLWHVPVIALVVARWPDIDLAAKATIVVAVSLPLAAVSYWLVERPLMSSRSRSALLATSRRRPRAPVA